MAFPVESVRVDVNLDYKHRFTEQHKAINYCAIRLDGLKRQFMAANVDLTKLLRSGCCHNIRVRWIRRVQRYTTTTRGDVLDPIYVGARSSDYAHKK